MRTHLYHPDDDAGRCARTDLECEGIPLLATSSLTSDGITYPALRLCTAARRESALWRGADGPYTGTWRVQIDQWLPGALSRPLRALSLILTCAAGTVRVVLNLDVAAHREALERIVAAGGMVLVPFDFDPASHSQNKGLVVHLCAAVLADLKQAITIARLGDALAHAGLRAWALPADDPGPRVRRVLGDHSTDSESRPHTQPA